MTVRPAMTTQPHPTLAWTSKAEGAGPSMHRITRTRLEREATRTLKRIREAGIISSRGSRGWHICREPVSCSCPSATLVAQGQLWTIYHRKSKSPKGQQRIHDDDDDDDDDDGRHGYQEKKKKKEGRAEGHHRQESFRWAQRQPLTPCNNVVTILRLLLITTLFWYAIYWRRSELYTGATEVVK